MKATHPIVTRPVIALLALLLNLQITACERHHTVHEEQAKAPDLTWPQWRGPSGQGLSSESGLPASWSGDSENIRWKTELPGVGNSSPIVSDGKVYLTAAVESKDNGNQSASPEGIVQRIVICLDLETGKILWTTEVFATGGGRIHRLNTLAAPTPATDGHRLYVYFGSMLAALDLDGQIVWKNEVDPDCYKYWKYGDATSPVLVDDKVVVFQDQEWSNKGDVGWAAAFHKTTGEQLWRSEWSDTCCSYATPIVIDRGSGKELLFPHAGYFASYDPSTGERQWAHDYEINQPVASPVVTGDVVPYTGGAHQTRATVALRLPEGDGSGPTLLWQKKNLASETSSPVAIDGRLYFITQKGIIYCVDAETGTQHWKRRFSRGGFHSSLVAGDGKIYATTNHGFTMVIAADKKYRLIAENNFGEQLSTASPAIADGCILIRSLTGLYCIQKEAEAADEAVTNG